MTNNFSAITRIITQIPDRVMVLSKRSANYELLKMRKKKEKNHAEQLNGFVLKIDDRVNLLI
jgi:hypothetical protein